MSKQLIFSFLGSGVAVYMDKIQPGSVIKFGSGFEGINMSFGGVQISPVSSENTASRAPVLEITATPTVVTPGVGAPLKKLKGVVVHEPYEPQLVSTQFEVGSTSTAAPTSLGLSSKSQRRNRNRRKRLRLQKEELRAAKAAEVQDIDTEDRDDQDGEATILPTSPLLGGSRFHPLSAAQGEENIKRIARSPPRPSEHVSEGLLRARALQSFHDRLRQLQTEIDKTGMTRDQTLEHLKLESARQLGAHVRGPPPPTTAAPSLVGRARHTPPVPTGANSIPLGPKGRKVETF